MRFASSAAKFTTAFARRGLIAEHSISWTLPRIIGTSRALDLLVSARTFAAPEALELGVINRICEPDQVVSEAMAYARFMTEATPFATQHGVKGDEFENVVVVIDDKAWNLYNMGKMLAGRDGEARIQRSRNLFYVCCSRAQRRLAVVFMTQVIGSEARLTLRRDLRTLVYSAMTESFA